MVRDYDTLKVIADPLRAQIVAILLHEPLNMRQVAERLGLAASKLYYHFGLLEKIGPLVLARHSAGAYGGVQMAFGVGMLAGSIAMSAWGGPRRRSPGIIGFIALGAVGLLITGLHPALIFPTAGLFLLMFAAPLAAGPSQAIFQSKVAPEVQGRVFAMRSMISRSMMPPAFLLAGPLADYVFEPLMQPGGALAGSVGGCWAPARAGAWG